LKKKSLDNVTLVTVTSVHLEDTVDALKYCCRGLDFSSVKFISHRKPSNLPNDFIFCRCSLIDSLESYSRFMMYSLKDYIDTAFCLNVQRDGVVIHPEQWKNTFLEYDYIGAPWPIHKNFCDQNDVYHRVGNGGFSLRSKKFLHTPTDLDIPDSVIVFQPDYDLFHNGRSVQKCFP